MDTENRLSRELAELNLLVRGLAKIPAFPAELLELISAKVESILSLTSQSNDMVEMENFSEIELIINNQEQPEIGSADVMYSDVQRVNDLLEQTRRIDFTRSLTLNDRFRFQREFFENDSQKMTEVFAAINETLTLEEALDYLRGVCTIDESFESFQDFYNMLSLHFTGLSNRSPFN